VTGEQLAAEGLADVVVGNQDKMRLPELLAETSAVPPEGSAPAPLVQVPSISRAPFEMATDFDWGGDTRASLKIQDGCDFMCSFCIIPTARGRARPRKLDNLLEQARVMAQSGAREIVLTGVNLGTYDQDGEGLLEVVDQLNRLEELARIRISSIEPTTVDTGLIERMADPSHRLVPFLHLPLQSGSDTILQAMKRRYSVGEWRAFAEQALDQVPDLCLGSDVMAGFPGENDEAFGETLSLLEALPLAYFHVFPFSSRSGTAAARLPGHTSGEVANRRVATLRALSEEKRMAFHRRHTGTVRPVLFERPTNESTARGYTDNYLRVEVAHLQPGTLRNQLIPVQLLEASAHTLAGVLAEGH